MSYKPLKPVHTTQLVFIRREGIEIPNIALATVTTAKKISVREAMKKLEAAVQDWVENTQSGRKCWDYSCGDLNIGDLATHEEQFTSDGQDCLRKQGILDFTIQYVGDLSEGTFSYDRVLAHESKKLSKE
jgi:hypothetical protein